MSRPRVIVVGAGVTGLAAACELVRNGIAVDLLSPAAPRRSIVASSADALAVAQTGDDGLASHVEDVMPSGAAPSSSAAVRWLVARGPELLDRLAASGVSFARDDAGRPIRLRGSGHRRERLATAGPTTKREIVEALDRELALATLARPDRVRRLEGWEVIELVVVDGACVGVVAQDLRSMEIHAIPARAVLLASGGFAGAWGTAAAPPAAIGGATAAALRAGATLAEIDAVDRAPLAVLGPSRAHAISDAIRTAGARVWLPLDSRETRRGRDVPPKERRDLLRDLDVASDRGIAPDATARVIQQALAAGDAGVFDPAAGTLEACVYLELGHLAGELLPGVAAEAARIRRITGRDLLAQPIRVAPAVQDTLGGLAVDFAIDALGELLEGSATHHGTTLPALYAAGSAAAAYHGRARLPGQRLLEALGGGELAARAIVAFCAATTTTTTSGPEGPEAHRTALEEAERAARTADASLLQRERGEPVRVLRAQLGALLDAVTAAAPEASADDLRARIEEVDGIDAQVARCGPDDRASVLNRGVPGVRGLTSAALLARAVIATAQARERADEAGGTAGRILVRWVNGALEVALETPARLDPEAGARLASETS